MPTGESLDHERLVSQTARILLECNFRCPFCFAAWHEENKKPTAAVMNTSGRDWRGYIDKMKARGYRRLTISGGEPTMHPDILPLIRHARALGFESIELQTNGSLLTEANARRLAKAGVTDALVSLHGHTEAIFDRITVTEGVFPTVVSGIRHLINAGINVMISHVIIAWNVEHLEGFVRFCHEELKGIREILFFSMQPEARARKNLHLWPKLDRVRANLPRALDEAIRLGVGFRMDSQEGFPMCFIEGHEERVDLADITDPEGTFGRDLSALKVIERKKVKLPQCRECFFEPACYGFWEGYFLLHGDQGFQAVPRSERLAALFPDLEAVHRGERPRPDLVPVRRKDQATWLEAEEVEELPMAWKEGREAAQRIK